MNRLILSRRGLFGVLVALTAVLGSTPALQNRFAQDDTSMVVEDVRVRTPAAWSGYLNEAYWPKGYPRYLYRPLSSLLMSMEWLAGGGAPLPFKLMQIALYAASAVAVFALTLRLLPAAAALASALLFAVHPVHVEAVALAVNQSEVLVGLISVLVVAWYYDRRRRGWLSVREQAGLAGVTLIAAHFKESGIMIPVLLMAVEMFLIAEPHWRERWRRLTSLVVWQTLAVVITVALRTRIEFGAASGTFIAEAFDGMSIGQRALTMLTVVPEWFRLLLWPETLAADYSPQRIMPVEQWGAAPALGLVILLLVAVLAWRVRRRVPALTFGVAWTAITLFPVSNVILPTGIPLAERTLFSPSVGAMICVGAVVSELWRRERVQRRWRVAAFAGMTLLVCTLGVLRSRSRHRVWHDSFRLWAQTVIDVPTSYRAWTAFGTMLRLSGHPEKAVGAYAEALRLWDRTSGPVYQLATWYREAGNCDAATPLYRRTLELTEFAPARTGLLSCLTRAGDYTEARAVALGGIQAGVFVTIFRGWFRTVDRAIRTQAPPGTVHYDRTLLDPAPATTATNTSP